MGKLNSAAFTGFLLCFGAIFFGIVTNGGVGAVLNLIHIPSFDFSAKLKKCSN